MRGQTGRSATVVIGMVGRAALGFPTESNLAVDSSADLAVDASEDLEIGSGVIWAGASAARTIET